MLTLTAFLLSTIVFGAMAQRPRAQFCTVDSRDAALRCMCLSYHPDFCSEEGPIPSCCRAGEDKTKATGGCHCCGSGKKAATVEERGTYQHVRE